jgi:MSHA biogenesis protein MshL
MVEDRMKRTITTLLIFFCFALVSCDAGRMNTRKEIKIPEEFRQTTPNQQATSKQAPAPPKAPDFVPVTEDISPIKTRIVDITARKTPLRDVLHVVADAVSLNLVMEKGVDPETEVNLTLKNVTAESALNTIFAAVDYFYKIEGNLLVVKAVDTNVFELGHPAMTQTYAVEVGGDIFGGAMNVNPSGGGGSSSTIKGSVSQTVKSDDTAFKFWDAVEKSIENILGGQAGDSAQAGPAQRFTINRLAGSIHVTATKQNLQRVENYVKSLKKIIGRQVLIEAKIIEVQLTDNLQFGVDWTLVDRFITTTDSGATRTTSSYTYATSRFKDIVSNTGQVFTITGAPSFGGAKADLNFVVNALQNQGDIRTLSNPKLNIMNGQTALLTVGRNQAYISKVETTTTSTGGGGITTYTVTTNSILSGFMIGILPYINEYGEISLTITPIVSELVKFTQQSVGSPSVIDISLPTVDLKELSTTVKVRNGDIVAIGGLISQKEKQSDNQVPFIGNIPVLGYFFKSRDKQESRTELVIILQPTLLNM